MVDRRRRARREERKTIVKKFDVSKLSKDFNNYILNDEGSPVRLVELAEADTSLAEEKAAHLFDGGTVMNTLVTSTIPLLEEGELVLDSDILADGALVTLDACQLQQQVSLDNVNAPISQASSSPIQNTVISAEAYNGRNDLWRNMHVRITEPMPCYNVGFYSLILSSADVARNLYTYVQDLVLHTVPIESNCMPTASEAGSIRLSSETVQDIMNQLWMMGFRPIERVREDDAEARALRSEITYLRSLVQSLTQANRASEQPSNST